MIFSNIKINLYKIYSMYIRFIILLFLFFPIFVFSFENIKIQIDDFSINKYEITIKEFKEFAKETNFITEAERTGGGYEWGAGWEKRQNWNYKTPYGVEPKSEYEPVAHVTYFEAQKYCAFKQGRLPSFDEWKRAAYFENGIEYEYPSGNKPLDMNTQDLLGIDKHEDVTKLKPGLNSLVAMGGNVWEWIDDINGDNSLTAGGSWWYGSSKTKASGAQYKPSNFYAIYIGFRCVFDN